MSCHYTPHGFGLPLKSFDVHRNIYCPHLNEMSGRGNLTSSLWVLPPIFFRPQGESCFITWNNVSFHVQHSWTPYQDYYLHYCTFCTCFSPPFLFLETLRQCEEWINIEDVQLTYQQPRRCSSWLKVPDWPMSFKYKSCSVSCIVHNNICWYSLQFLFLCAQDWN